MYYVLQEYETKTKSLLSNRLLSYLTSQLRRFGDLKLLGENLNYFTESNFLSKLWNHKRITVEFLAVY